MVVGSNACKALLLAVLVLGAAGSTSTPAGATTGVAVNDVGEPASLSDEIKRDGAATTDPEPAVADTLANASGTEVVVLNVDREIAPPTQADVDANNLKADSRATLGPVVAAVEELEAATVRQQVWTGNLVTVAVDFDTHTVSELTAIDGVTHVVPNVEFDHPAETNVSASPANTTATERNVTYGLAQMDLPGFEAKFGDRGGNATIAIIDDGLSDPEAGHPDLNITQRFLIVDGEITAGEVEEGAHGEHVAGTATGAAEPAGDVPRYGVAPDAELIKIDTFGETPGATFEDIALGLETAAEEDADVAGFSLGAANSDFDESTFAPTFTDTIEDAKAANTVVTVSAGNEGDGEDGGQVTTPGTQFESFTVGATDNNSEVAAFSSGALINDDRVRTVAGDPVALPETFPKQYVKPDVSAAGVDVLSAGPLGMTVDDPAAEYSVARGTSMAQPHVAGAVALLQSVSDEELTPAEIKAVLTETAERPGDRTRPAVAARDIRYGTGIINVTAAALAIDDLHTATGTVSTDNGSFPGAVVKTPDGALTAANETGAVTVPTTSDTVTIDAFGFAPQTIALNTTDNGSTDLGEITLNDSADTILLDNYPATVSPGETIDLSLAATNVETVTISDTEASEIATDNITVELNGEEIALDEPVNTTDEDIDLAITTTETARGVLDLTYTFAGAEREHQNDALSEEIVVADGAFFAVSNLTAPTQTAPGVEVAINATITNHGSETDTQTSTLQGNGTGGAEQPVALAPGESESVTFSGVELPAETGDAEYTVTTVNDSQSTTIEVVQTAINITANRTMLGTVADEQNATVTADGLLGADRMAVKIAGTPIRSTAVENGSAVVDFDPTSLDIDPTENATVSVSNVPADGPTVDVVHETRGLTPGGNFVSVPQPATLSVADVDAVNRWDTAEHTYTDANETEAAVTAVEELHQGMYLNATTSTAKLGVTFETTPGQNGTATLGDGWTLAGTNFDIAREGANRTLAADLAGVDNVSELTVVRGADRTAELNATDTVEAFDAYWVYAETPRERTITAPAYNRTERAVSLE